MTLSFSEKRFLIRISDRAFVTNDGLVVDPLDARKFMHREEAEYFTKQYSGQIVEYEFHWQEVEQPSSADCDE